MGLSPRRHRCQRLGLLNPRQTLGAKEGSVPEASGHEAEEAPLPPHGAPYQLNYCPLVAGASVELYEWTVDPAGERNLAGTRPDLAGVTPVPALRLGSQRSRADRPGLAPRGSRRAGGRVRAPEMRLRFDGRPRYRPHLHHGVDPARGGLGFLRARVLGPLVLFQAGVRPNGVRRVEQSVPARVPPLRSTMTSPEFMVIAHRGASSYAPENTLAAFDLAIQMGVSHIELDVHFTRDDHVVVIHDDTVNRTTNGSGPVTSHALAALQGLDAGSWFGGKFARERIPTFEEILERYQGRAHLHTEIKGHSAHLSQRTADLVRRRGMAGQVTITSFQRTRLEEARAHAPELPRGWGPRGSSTQSSWPPSCRCYDQQWKDRATEAVSALPPSPPPAQGESCHPTGQ